MVGRLGRVLAIAVGTVLAAGCSADGGGMSNPAAKGPAATPPTSPSPTPTKKYSAIGSWNPIYTTVHTDMFLFKVEKNGDVSTMGEPLVGSSARDGLVLCTGKLASLSLPTTVKLSCLDTGELTETAAPGGLDVPEYKGLVDVVGEVPDSLKKYGREILMIKWTGGQKDLLYKGPYAGGGAL
jgi:hypothetical protein